MAVILADRAPLWPSELTAWGTLALAAVTVAAIITTIMITVQDRKRADKEIADERTAAEKRLAEQTNAAESRLKASMEHSDQQLREQQKAADTQLQEERQLAQEQEQLSEAWSVQVLGVRIPPGEHVINTPENPSQCPVAIVINRGRYTITQVDAYFSNGSATYARERHESYSDIETCHSISGVM